jgi:hypothetical protein
MSIFAARVGPSTPTLRTGLPGLAHQLFCFVALGTLLLTTPVFTHAAPFTEAPIVGGPPI